MKNNVVKYQNCCQQVINLVDAEISLLFFFFFSVSLRCDKNECWNKKKNWGKRTGSEWKSKARDIALFMLDYSSFQADLLVSHITLCDSIVCVSRLSETKTRETDAFQTGWMFSISICAKVSNVFAFDFYWIVKAELLYYSAQWYFSIRHTWFTGYVEVGYWFWPSLR